jgi:diguanylate cyclase (GGDEF)-like protein
VDGRTARVRLAVFALCCLGACAAAVVALVEAPHVDWTSTALLPAYLFAGLLMLGELRPLLVTRDDGETDTVTVSTTFAVCLVITGPLLLAMVAQALAVAFEDVRCARSPLKLAFNVSQYLVTLVAARWVFCSASGRPLVDATTGMDPGDILPGLLAGLTFLAVNNGLVAGIVAIGTRQSPWRIVAEDIRAQGLASSILLALAPLGAIAADFSLFTVPLVILPLLGVQHSADIAAQRQHEALHDGLTGLPNRTLLRHRMQSAVEAVNRQQSADGTNRSPTNDAVVVMLLDLDHFKEVNDTLGHHMGDALLREVAFRLTRACPTKVTVSRLGGDEFCVLAPRTSRDEALRLAEDISLALRAPAVIEGVRVAMQASIGVALAPSHATTVDGLLQRADIALYQAKEQRGSVELYQQKFDTHTVARLNLVADLNTAVRDQQMFLAYQPLADARTNSIVGLEALLRWSHPTQGAVPPSEFIPLAERSGAISAISYYVLDQALAMARQLHDSGQVLSMSINLSARLLTDLALPEAVANALSTYDVPARLLTVEVTESTIAADPKRALELLAELRALGVRLSIDDFGTGYSSLSYLSRLQPDELKVDRSFVQALRGRHRDQAIVRSTIELGHALGMDVVAEGVEDVDTYARLLELGCDRMQGHLVSRPLTPEQLHAWLGRELEVVSPLAATRLSNSESR